LANIVYAARVDLASKVEAKQMTPEDATTATVMIASIRALLPPLARFTQLSTPVLTALTMWIFSTTHIVWGDEAKPLVAALAREWHDLNACSPCLGFAIVPMGIGRME
jgi:hypothetical protein